MNTKIHLAVDAVGRPIRMPFTGGQRNDITQAQALLKGPARRYVLAHKGYDSRALVEAIQAQGAQAVIPCAVASSHAPLTKSSTDCVIASIGASHS